MSLDWIPRAPKDEKLDHRMYDETYFQKSEPPRTTLQKRPLLDNQGNEVPDLYVAWVTLDNEKQYNSYTLEMLKGAAAAFDKASHDPSVVCVVLTGAGTKAFCTGGNVPEYSEYYVMRPSDCQEYMSVYWRAYDAVWTSPKPFIRCCNGMSIGGGEELGGVCDLTVASDCATFGQVGPLHGSTAMGGAVQFKPIEMSMQDAMWNAISCEQWSAYKMLRKNYLHKVVPVLKKDGEFIRNPAVITDQWVEDGEIVYGEFKTGEVAKEAKAMLKELPRDRSLLDKTCMDMAWTFANLFPQQVAMSFQMIRATKKVAWERTKAESIMWWAGNAQAYGEFDMGMSAFNTKKITGTSDVDIIKLRQMIAKGHPYDEEMFEAVLGKPQK
ncbi:MAG: enoyl-CoA hydratase-related protein [Thermodesulfobacteriota bacterium]